MERELKDLPKYAYDEFRSITPIRTGNAKRKTDLKGNEIQGNYPYANRLNDGWSKQAPEGMTDPTITKLRAKVRSI